MAADHGQFDNAQIVGNQLFAAHGDAAFFFQPTDATLDNVALAVSFPVEFSGCAPLRGSRPSRKSEE